MGDIKRNNRTKEKQMSSRPGYDMEAYLRWLFDLTVENTDDANESIRIAEILGTAGRKRQHLTQHQFGLLVGMYEEHRDTIEYRLQDFNDDEQSWRSYAGCAFDFIPEALNDEGAAYINSVLAETPAGEEIKE